MSQMFVISVTFISWTPPSKSVPYESSVFRAADVLTKHLMNYGQNVSRVLVVPQLVDLFRLPEILCPERETRDFRYSKKVADTLCSSKRSRLFLLWPIWLRWQTILLRTGVWNFFLSNLFCLRHFSCRRLHFHLIIHNETHLVGLPWTSDRPVTQACTYTTNPRDKNIYAPSWIRNQQSSGRRPP